MDIANLKQSLNTMRFSIPSQAIRMECFSLKSYTRYYVIFDTLDYSSMCMQDGKAMGDALISDGYGKLNFTFYWNRSNEASMLENRMFNSLFDDNIGNKLMTITDKSGSSFINKTIFFTNNNPDIMFSKYTNASNITLT